METNCPSERGKRTPFLPRIFFKVVENNAFDFCQHYLHTYTTTHVLLEGNFCKEQHFTAEASVVLTVSVVFFKMGQSRPLFRLFSVFFKKTSIQFCNKLMWKNVHPVYGPGIRTHDLHNMSLLPLPLDQGSRPTLSVVNAVFWGWETRFPHIINLKSFFLIIVPFKAKISSKTVHC